MRYRIPLPACLLLAITLCAGMAAAQDNPPPEPTEQPLAVATTPRNDTKLKVPELGGKYASWVHHTGNAKESVVAVRIVATNEHGDVVTRTGSGLVMRCDGFLLIPDALAPPNDRAFDAEISLVKMDGEEITAPLAPVGRPQFRYHRTPYVTLKVNDHHIPCLPLLHPRNVEPNLAVRVTWAIPDPDKPGHVRIVSRKGIVGAKTGKENRFYLKLTGVTGANAPEPILGATVTDEKGIAGLGMISETPTASDGTGTDLSFSTFARLDYMCEEVGLRPSLADITGSDTGQKTGEGMVTVPGGPVRVPRGPMGEYYGRYYKTDVVCTPPFKMDVLPVTIADYRNFLRRLKAPRLPQAWEKDFPSELERDIRRGDLPITGAGYEDVLLYAEAQDKRLPTSVEWLEAAQGADTDWVARYMAESAEYYKVVSNIYQRKIDHWAEVLERLTQGKGSGRPAKVYVDDAPLHELNRQQYVTQLDYFRTHKWPIEVNAPVDIREQDVSAYGVKDVVCNAPEMTIKNYARPYSGGAPKLIPALADMYLTSIEYKYQSSVSDTQDPMSALEGNEYTSQIDRDDPSQVDYAFGLIGLSCGQYDFYERAWYNAYEVSPGKSHFTLGEFTFTMRIRPHNYPGFRCAK